MADSRTVNAETLHLILSKADGLNRRAVKMGVAPFEVSYTDAEPKVARSGDLIPQYTIRIGGQLPRFEGYTLGAVIEKDPTIGTLVKVVPGPYADRDYSSYRDCTFQCEHCGTTRGRSKVFVIWSPDGKAMLIGRNCLADYCRCGDAENLLNLYLSAEDLRDTPEWETFQGRAIKICGLVRFLAMVQACVREFGWVSRSGGKGGIATADIALCVLFDLPSKSVNELRARVQVTDADRELAAQATAWAASHEPSNNEYVNTICQIAQAGETTDKLAGYAASILRAYQKYLGWEEERLAAPTIHKVYLGEPCKTRDLGAVVVKRLHWIEGDYGTTTIVSMQKQISDNEVANITWFCSSAAPDPKVGGTYNLRAGIKACTDSPKYGKQTVVTRAKLTEILDE